MPTSDLIDARHARRKEQTTALLTRLVDLAARTGEAEARDVASRLVEAVGAPFLFVVLGEVKSGKSSFVNALLEAEVCEVAPDPCTDRIQRLVYAASPHARELAPHVTEKGVDADILREIAVVDTPGTNSIIDVHQEVTERFLPESDLAVFVFPATNPYTQSAWDFLSLVHERWLKKVVFVLQQSDRASPEELAVARQRVVEFARQRGMSDPLVFAASAARAADDPEGSGMAAVRDYIRDHVTRGAHLTEKLTSVLGSARRVLDDVQGWMDAQQSALDQDRAVADDIGTRLEAGRAAALSQAETLTAGLLTAYDAAVLEAVEEFGAGLSLPQLLKRSVAGVFRREQALKGWVERLGSEFNSRFLREVNTAASLGAGRLAEEVAYLTDSLVRELGQRRQDAPDTSLSVDRLTRDRLAVIDQVAAQVSGLLSREDFKGRLAPLEIRRLGDRTVMGGVLGGLGAVIAGATHMAVFDVTGGLMAAAGTIIAVNTLVLKRRGVIRRFRKGFDQGRERFAAELSSRLPAQVEAIFTEIRSAFTPFFEDIDRRGRILDGLSTDFRRLEEDIAHLADSLATEDRTS